jgi:hypothetical protein
MAAKFTVISEVASATTAVTILSTGSLSALANSYPDDIKRALASTETTMTGDGDRELAFKRAGLR